MDFRKKRCANYTETEKSKLLEIVGKYVVIEYKQFDGATNKKKQDAWKNVEIEFNSCCSTTGPRDWRQLRVLWENLKKKAKKSVPDQNRKQYYEKPDRETNSQDELSLSSIDEIDINGIGGNNDPQEDDTTAHALTAIKDQIGRLDNPFDDGSDHFGGNNFDSYQKNLTYKEKWESLRAQQLKLLNKQKTLQLIGSAYGYEDQTEFPPETLYDTEEDAEEQVNEGQIEYIVKEEDSEGGTTIVELPKIRKRKKTAPSSGNAVVLQQNGACDPIDTFFSLMASSVKNFDPLDQHYIRTKVFSLVSDMEEKYLRRNHNKTNMPETSIQ